MDEKDINIIEVCFYKACPGYITGIYGKFTLKNITELEDVLQELDCLRWKEWMSKDYEFPKNFFESLWSDHEFIKIRFEVEVVFYDDFDNDYSYHLNYIKTIEKG